MRISQVCKGHRMLSRDDAPACDVRQRAAEILATLASADHLQFPGQFEPRQPPRNQRRRPNGHHPKRPEGPGEALPSQTLPLLAPGLTPLSAGCRGGWGRLGGGGVRQRGRGGDVDPIRRISIRARGRSKAATGQTHVGTRPEARPTEEFSLASGGVSTRDPRGAATLQRTRRGRPPGLPNGTGTLL